MLGVLVYEFTTSPALGAAMLSLKFGWGDFRTAVWLRRTDPDAGRGRACFWLYAAAGLWKVALASVVIFWAVALIATPMQGLRLGQQRRAFFLKVFVTGMALSASSCGLATLASYAALLWARLLGVRLWYNREVHRAARERVWPPLFGRTNEARLVFVFAAVTTYLVGMALVPMGVSQLAPAGAGFGHLIAFATVLWVILFGPLLIRASADQGWRASAARPEDCWGTD